MIEEIKYTLAGGLVTTAVLWYTSISNPPCDFDLEKELPIMSDAIAVSSVYDPNPYYEISSQKSPINSQIEIIYNFVSALVENSKDLDPDFSKAVDKHFWELA